MQLRFFFITALLAFSSIIYASAQQNNKEVLVLEEPDSVPPGARFVGDIKVRLGTVFEATYSDVIDEAKEKTLKKEGNILKITQIEYPDGWKSSYRLRAEVYHLDNIDTQLTKKAAQRDSIVNTLIPKNADYAMLVVYRPRSSVGAMIEYNLHANDSVIYRLTNGSRRKIPLRPGKTTLWARTEARKELSVDIKPGRVYFLRCFVSMGILVGEPNFELVDGYDGYIDYKYNGYWDDLKD